MQKALNKQWNCTNALGEINTRKTPFYDMGFKSEPKIKPATLDDLDLLINNPAIEKLIDEKNRNITLTEKLKELTSKDIDSGTGMFKYNKKFWTDLREVLGKEDK
jgi:hypothetical protein